MTKVGNFQKGVIAKIITKDPEAQTAFAKATFGATVTFDFPSDDGRIFHRSLDISGRMVMLEDRAVNIDLTAEAKGKSEGKGEDKDKDKGEDKGEDKASQGERCPGSKNEEIEIGLYMNVPDAAALESKIVAGGGTVVVPVAEQFWGATYGSVRDPRGILWCISQSPAGEVASDADGPDVLIPNITATDASAYLGWLKDNLGAEVVGEPTEAKEGKIMHAIVKINGGTIFVNDDFDGSGSRASSVMVDVPAGEGEAIETKALAAGGTSVMKVVKQFWGSVFGMLEDGTGTMWGIAEPRGESDKDVIDANAAVAHKRGWENTVTCLRVTAPRWRLVHVSRDGVKMEDLKAFFADVLPRTFAAAGAEKVVGAPVAVYRSYKMGDKGPVEFDVSAGVPIAEGTEISLESTGDIQIAEFGGDDCAMATHVGSYETLKMSYDSIMAFAAEMKLAPVPARCYEVYLSDPSTTAEKDLKTEVYHSVQDASKQAKTDDGAGKA